MSFEFYAKLSTKDLSKDIMDALDELVKSEVLVGIPEESNGRTTEGSVAATNAELLYIHTNGSPINNIPARRVIEPAIEHNKEQVAELLKGAADAALGGDKSGARAALDKAGQHGANISKEWFTNKANGWKDNKPETVERKGSGRPLIDSGELRKAITYKVEKS